MPEPLINQVATGPPRVFRIEKLFKTWMHAALAALRNTVR
jgi:hypothetical protein